MIEVSLNLGKTPQKEITDGAILEQVLADMSFGDVKLDKFVYVVTSKDGIVGGQSYNQPPVLGDRTIDANTLTSADAVFVDVSVKKFLGQKSRSDVSKVIEYRKRLNELKPAQKQLKSIGEALVLFRQQFGNEKLATRPQKEYLQVAAMQRDRNRHNKSSFAKKNIVCWQCDKKGPHEKRIQILRPRAKQFGRKTHKWKKKK